MKYGNQLVDPALAIRTNLLKWVEKPTLAFTADSPKAAAAWQRKARSTFDNLLGDRPESTPLKPEILETTQLAGYTRETLLLQTAPHIKALCWFCVPDGVSASSPAPAMIATPGHGMGAKDLLALDKDGNPRAEGDGYQKDYALQAVRLGHPVLVIEPLGFGERRDLDMIKGQTPEQGCHAAFSIALMLGTTLQRIRIHELQRGLDYLQTRPEVTQSQGKSQGKSKGKSATPQAGIMGISGGGQMSLWAAALDPRFKVAAVSGYTNTFTDSVMAMNHCICNFAPGVRKHLEMTDLAALIAPRPILIEGGTEDPIFPIKATRAAIRTTRKHYDVWDASKLVYSDIFKADHQWSGRKLAALLKHL